MEAEVGSIAAVMSPNGSSVRAGTGSRSDDAAPPETAPRFDARTRVLLEGPIVSTLLRLATPNVLVMFVQASVGLIETYFVAKLGTDALAAVVTSVGAAALIPLSPCLIFGWGLFPRLGVAGGAVAVIAFYVAGSVALVAYLRTGRSVVRLSFADVRFRWSLFRDILRVGAVAALITVQTNLTIAIATGFVGRFGPAAIAGYGIGSRLESLLVPLVFGR